MQLLPKHYELDQILKFLSTHRRLATEGYFMERLWKYIVYSEVLFAISERIRMGRPTGIVSRIESAVLAHIDNDVELFQLSLPHRIVRLLELQPVESLAIIVVGEGTISAQLHRTQLRDMNSLISTYLNEQRVRLTVQVDRLDGTWSQAHDRDLMTDILLALVEAGRDMWRSWSNALPGGRRQGSAGVTMFLRSDIYESIQKRSPEAHKLNPELLYWDDASLLLDVIGRRISASVVPADVETFDWNTILTKGFAYSDLQSFVDVNLLLRPRDVIYYFDKVISFAVEHRRNKIDRRTMNAARRAYSEYALSALSAEWNPVVEDTETLVWSFIGRSAALQREELDEILREAGVPDNRHVEAIGFLIETGFLGLGANARGHRFGTTPTRALSMRQQVGRHRGGKGGKQSFVVHPAFRESLDLTA